MPCAGGKHVNLLERNAKKVKHYTQPIFEVIKVSMLPELKVKCDKA